MALSIGIIGLPNVGKSTLFQTLTQKEVDRSNYPFATIDPNIGVLPIQDSRLEKLASISGVAGKKYATVEFIDIAGVVKGAHAGEGLGNQFLAHIREVDAVVFVLRAFSDSNVVHQEAEINPLQDKEILDLELGLKDLEVVLKRLDHIKKEASEETPVLKKAKEVLESKNLLLSHQWKDKELEILGRYQFLTLKKRLYLLNVDPSGAGENLIKKFDPVVVMNVADEFAASGFSREERKEVGLTLESPIEKLIKKSYELLGLITFFTIAGGREVGAWAVPVGTTAAKAAGKIHRDFEEKFIRAEVINYESLVSVDSIANARQKGLIRTEGRDYVVQEGDVVEIKHGT